ncbi:hypothetical protein [Paenibacillus dendritiformis]|uniref:hypothetical protein n=1 Tax=Paenibacillus dendritiformis TaxID=130049 RepID=UPI00387E1FC0
MSIKGDVLPGGINQEIQGVTTQTRAHPDDFNPNVLKPLLDNDVTMSKQLETLPSEALTFRPGYQIVESEHDAPFRLGEIKGRTLVNLLGRAGACDNAELWTDYQTTHTIDQTLFVSPKGASGGSAVTKTKVLFEESKFYLLIGKAKLGTATTASLSVSGYMEDTKTQAANNKEFQVLYKAIANFSTPDARGINANVFGGEGVSAYFVDVRLYEISQVEYDAIAKMTPEQVAELYPYVDSMTNVKNPYAIVTGGNLLPPVYEWEQDRGIVIDGEYCVNAGPPIPGASRFCKSPRIPVRPGQSVRADCLVTGRGQLSMQFWSADNRLISESQLAQGTSDMKDVQIGGYRVAPEGAMSFTVRVGRTVAITDDIITFRDMVAGFGIEKLDFAPQQCSMLAFETELAAHPVDGSNPDTLFMGDDGLPYVLESWKKVTLDGSLEWKDPGSVADFTIVGTSLGQAAGFDAFECVKFDGTLLTKNGDMTKGDNAYFIIASQHKEFRVSIFNTDSGWGPGYTPTREEIIAYFLGWKMYDGLAHGDGTGTYDRTDGLYKTWTPLDSFNGTFYHGVYSGSGTPKEVPSTANATYYIKHRHWQPYRLQYLKVKPTAESVRNYELGTAILCGGSNMVEVGSGIVIREKANPSVNIGWGHAVINRIDGINGTLKYMARNFYGIYRNTNRDNNWLQLDSTQEPYAYGLSTARMEVQYFDPTAIYHVTYTMLDPTLVAPISGTTASNLRGTVSDLVQDVGDVQRRLSVVETQKAEKDTQPPERIKPTLLHGWEDYGASFERSFYYKDESNVVAFEGLIRNGAAALGTPLLILPEGFRPERTLVFPVLGWVSGVGDALVRIDVEPTGVVKIGSPNAKNDYLSLQGISFLAMK